jgi:hypothetical protein
MVSAGLLSTSTPGRCGNHEWLARMRPRGQRTGCLTGFILAILILYRNRSKWPARDRNVLAISMTESKWIEIDRNELASRRNGWRADETETHCQPTP